MNDGIHIEDILNKEGMYISTTSGVSMYPMMRDRRDTILIRPKTGRLKKYDVPLYRRGDSYVLHRIIRVLPDGYDIRGDNCFATEHAVPEECIIGVLEGFWRNDKEIDLRSASHRAYVRLWVFLHPVICFIKRLRGFAAGVRRRLFSK